MNSYIEIYLHLVWGTWNRYDWILPEFERALWGELRSEVLKHDCRLLALGGTSNHVHLLVQFHSTLTVAQLLKDVKGPSSLWVNDQIRPDFQFKWQGAYGAFSVGRAEVPRIKNYIKNQKKHHAEGTTIDEYERMNRKD